MATYETAGLAGKKITVQPSKFDDGNVLITIIDRNGSQASIALPAHTANMLANALEHEAVDAFAIELAIDSQKKTLSLPVRDEKWIDSYAPAYSAKAVSA